MKQTNNRGMWLALGVTLGVVLALSTPGLALTIGRWILLVAVAIFVFAFTMATAHRSRRKTPTAQMFADRAEVTRRTR